MITMNAKYLSTIQQVNYYAFLLWVFTLPFPRIMSHYMLIVWFVTWVMELRFTNKQNLHLDRSIIPAIGLLIWVILELLSLTWGHHSEYHTHFRDAHISFIVAPLVALYGVNHHYNWKAATLALTIGSICSTIMYINTAYWIFNIQTVYHGAATVKPGPFHLYYFTVLSPIKHRLYHCCILTINIILLTLQYKAIFSKLGKWFGAIAYGLLTAGMLLVIYCTESRASLLALVALAAIGAFHLIPRRFRIVTAVVSVLLGAGAVYTLHQYHPRMSQLTLERITNAEQHYTEMDFEPRIMIWRLALQSPQDYFLSGLGVNNATPYLINKYEEHGNLQRYIEQAYHAHNQYLEILMELGIFAMVAFMVLWIFFPFCYPKGSVNRRFALYIAVLFGMNMLTDRLITNIEGVIYLDAIIVLLCIPYNTPSTSNELTLAANNETELTTTES